MSNKKQQDYNAQNNEAVIDRRKAISRLAGAAIGAAVIGWAAAGYLAASPVTVERTVTATVTQPATTITATTTAPGVTTTVTAAATTITQTQTVTETQATTVTKTVTAGAPLPSTIRVAVFSHYEAVPKMMAPFFTKRTGIDVEFETVVAAEHRDKFISAHRAGTSAWDILPLWATSVQEMAHRGWLVDLTDLIESIFGPDRGGIVDVWDAATYKGRIYAVPDKIGGPILQWNKELLKEAGLDPERPAEWWKIKGSIDEFTEYCKATTFVKDGVEYWGFADQWGFEVIWSFNMFTQMFGGVTMDLTKNQPWGEPVMNQKPAVDALTWMVKMLNEWKCIDPASPTYNWVFDFTPGYLNGTVAMIITWPFIIHVAQNPEQSKIVGKTGFAPNFAAETTASVDGSEWQAISKFAPNGADAAWMWLEHVTSFDMMRRQALDGVWAPIYKSLLTDPEVVEKMPEAPVIRIVYDNPHSMFFTPDFAAWTDIMRDEIHAALRLEKTPQQAMDDCVRRINELRATY
jgi:multiple sugar transport system substrate-binding protein